MDELRGTLYDGRSSRARPATLRPYADGTVRIQAEGATRELALAELEVPARLGNTVRRIGLPDGGTFETPDNDGVDAMLRHPGARPGGWLHWLESRIAWVLLATVAVVAAGAGFVVHGVPLFARQAAFALPAETTTWLSSGALELLDQELERSELPEARRRELEELFGRVVADAPAGYRFELVFRGGGGFGANALALPSGAVVLTDELVSLARDEAELAAVLAHEVGHVVHRHGLRQAIQDSLVGLAILLVVGDLSSTSSVVAGLPALLAESRFSREFEREADEHAVAWLRAHAIDPVHFARILRRMEEEQGELPFDLSFLSSHPTTEERIARLGRGAAEAGHAPEP